MRNWAGNYEYQAPRLHYPKTVEEVRRLVADTSKLRVLGTRHSFNHIADNAGGDLVSLRHLDRVVRLELHPDRPTVTVEGGVRYGDLCRHLHAEGYALHNLASLPHISVAGACATATHGSGVGNGNLSTAVAAMEVVKADGDVEVLSREKDGERFQGAVVGLGGLGVVTRLTLDLVPAFRVRQEVFEHLPFAQAKRHFEQIVSGAYSVSLFTDWRGPSFNQVWFKRREADAVPAELSSWLRGAVPAPDHRHPLAHLSAENCTEQMGVPGPWHERLPHFRMDFTPSSGVELQSEYFVPLRRAAEALDAVDALRERIAPLLLISEVRTIAEDGLWMSPCYQQASVAIHFTWKQNWDAVADLLPRIEEQLASLGVRPHWGKLFTLPSAEVRSRYPKLADFQGLLRDFDPAGKFRNPFLDDYVFGPP